MGAAAALIALAAAPARAQCSGANGGAASVACREREAVGELVRSLVSAWNRGDAGSLAALFAPEGQLAAPPRRQISRTRPEIEQRIARELRTRLDGTTLKPRVDRIDFPSADRAVLEGKYEIRGVHLLFGLSVSFDGPFTLRLRKRENGWEILQADVRRRS
jgi:uncharacterized protein (TIGR02246 family)